MGACGFPQHRSKCRRFRRWPAAAVSFIGDFKIPRLVDTSLSGAGLGGRAHCVEAREEILGGFFLRNDAAPAFFTSLSAPLLGSNGSVAKYCSPGPCDRSPSRDAGVKSCNYGGSRRRRAVGMAASKAPGATARPPMCHAPWNGRWWPSCAPRRTACAAG